ncbi:DUF1318 domain-containing protein [Candidatus Thiosymbion oneisti]|uniref:DUF1318 domain-containing protein n=1 Tax=Candidatus Thiosymbion oneisti TaxID=589554 RepID=UPI000B7FBC24|nr:DUF1318 domain-containing protein [Candidatus Thiosymbion oneisti]
MKKQVGISGVKRVAWVVALTLALLLPAVAYALSVGEAKQKGLVAETGRGYLRAQKGTPEVKRLVNQTNAARKQKYREIAKRLKVGLDVVERDFGKKLGGR